MNPFRLPALLLASYSLLLFSLPNPAFAQTWARTYGGADYDNAQSIQPTTDGGFVVAGMTESFGEGWLDAWVLKLNASGNIEWQKTYGAADDDWAWLVQQTADGGLIVVGGTNSFGAGNWDFWVLKLDTSGNVTWQKTYGGASSDYAFSIQQTADGGFVVAGRTQSFGAGSNDSWLLKLDASGNVTWQKTYGGTNAEQVDSIQQTTDGGYIVAGSTDSFGAGGYDSWVLKLDASGNVLWQKTYGGALGDSARSIQQTADGGFVVAGIANISGPGSGDFWVLKLDASGNVTWQKTYGGASGEGAYSVQQTTDGGYVVAGITQSFGAGSDDSWILKLDALGTVTWQKAYGGANREEIYSIQQTTDGSFVAAGWAQSFGAGLDDFWVLKLDALGDIDASCTFIAVTAVTGADTFIVPAITAVTGVDSGAVPADTAVTPANSSATVNEQCYGCTADSFEPDGNCYVTKSVILGGEVQSHNFCDNTEDWISFNACTGRSYTIDAVPIGPLADVALELYDNDCASLLDSNYGGAPGTPASIMWTAPADGTYHIKVLQFDATPGKDRDYDITLTGDTSPCITWARTYGGTDSDEANSIQQTADGGYVVAGRTRSFGAGSVDLWVLKLDATGNVEWQKTYGGANWDYARSIQQTTDGGFIVAGDTRSFSAGWYDFWILKLDASGTVVWQKTYGGVWDDLAYSIRQTADNGYVVAGVTYSFGAGNYDFWVLKLDASGNTSWQKTYGGANWDYARSIQQTTDGGYVVAGETYSFGAGDQDFWVLKLDASGNTSWQKTYGGTSIDIAYSIQQTTDGGFVLAGRTDSFGAGGYDFWILKLDASGNTSWQKTYGGVDLDEAYSIQQTTDGGFVLAGCTESFGAGFTDAWVLKMDASGNVTWQKTYGSGGSDGVYSIRQTTDGGYVVAGRTWSFGVGSSDDFWVLKLDGSGNIDASCTFIADTAVTGADSAATVTYSAVTGGDSPAVPADSTATVTDSTATFCDSCTLLSDILPNAPVICPGGSQTLDANPSGGVLPYTYFWWSTGATTQTITVSPAVTTAYAVTVTDANSCSALSFETVTVSDPPASDILPHTPVICVGDTYVVLDANPSGGVPPYTYLWSTGATTQTITVSPVVTTAYDVTVTDALGCISQLESETVTVCPTWWARTYGGTDWDVAESIQQTSDGGYVAAGHEYSFGAADLDIWVLKLDMEGNVEWQKTYGGALDDYAYSIQQTTDGGYVVAGRTNSFGAGGPDFWVLKLDALGIVTWQKTYGGSSSDIADFIQQTTDGGFVVAGHTFSFGAGNYDFWVLKLDASGDVTWQKTYGGTFGEFAYSIQQTTDGGFVVAGRAQSFGPSNSDFWVLKLDASGNVTWQKTYGGSSSDLARSIQQTTDGGFVVAGNTTSFGAGSTDFWVLKLDASGDVTWQKTYGGTFGEFAYSIQQTTDGGFVVAGRTGSFGAGLEDIWVLKLDASGNVEWQKTYGGAGDDGNDSVDIRQTSDGGFVVAGDTESFGAGSFDFWVLKLDANGNIAASCAFIADTAVAGADTVATVNDTAVTGADSLGASAISTATPADSTATVEEQCSGCFADAYEEDDSCFASATVIHGGETFSLNFCNDAADWLSFNACTDRSYTIETSNLGAACDTVLELYDADCTTLLDSDDNGGGGNASLINWTAPGNRTYHVKVLQFDATTGKDRDYDITLMGGTSPCATWARAYGEASTETAYSIQQTTDGGFVVAGWTDSFGAGNWDAWVLKLDASGNVQWQKTYGGGTADYACSIQQTTDGGYVVAGWTASFGAGSWDAWVLKLDASGNVQWQKTYGGGLWDYAFFIQQTSDSGFVVAGYTQSFGAGLYDAWVLKLDALGNVTWQKTYGGGSQDYIRTIQQTTDGGFVVLAYTNSFGAGLYDAWVLKLDALGNVSWQKTYGGASNDRAFSMQKTADGGFVVTGRTSSFGVDVEDFWVLKLDASGNVSWQKTYGGSFDDWANSIQQTTDGGFVVAGQTDSFGAGADDFWVLKLDASGNVAWQKTYGGALEDVAISIKQTADGGYVVAGRTQSFGAGNDDAWILKLDANGEIDASCTFIADTAVSPADTAATVTDTIVTPTDTAATVTDPGVSGVVSAAAVAEQCSRAVCELIPCEPSGSGGDFPLHLESDAGSPTGYYFYFQKILDATAYHLYEGTLGAWYDHGAGAVCDLAVGPALDDMGNGELRYAITPAAGDHYYLVTARDAATETTSGYDSASVERDPLQSTCPP